MLAMSNLIAILPEVEAADTLYWRALRAVRENDALEAITDTYNEVLARAAEALYLDTADRNSRDTILQVYRPATRYATWFGQSPLAVLQQFAELKDK